MSEPPMPGPSPVPPAAAPESAAAEARFVPPLTPGSPAEGAGAQRWRAVAGALRRTVTALAIGFACVGVWTLFIGSLVHVSVWVAMALGTSAVAQAVLGTLVIGLAQAVICLATLAFLALLFDISRRVAAAAGAIAGGLPMLINLLHGDQDALADGRVMAVRAALVALCALAAWFAAGAVRSRISRRLPAPTAPSAPIAFASLDVPAPRVAADEQELP